MMNFGHIDRLSRMRPLAIALVVSLFVGTLFATGPAAARYAAIVIDAESGTVLHERHADKRRHPASLTKMMTLYLMFDALDKGEFRLDQKLTVSRRASRQSPSKLGLRRGQKISVKNAILALVTKSANDVAVVIAEAISGTEANFARKMTLKARQLGMRRTTFRNASGLYNRGQLTTARDLAKLSMALLTNHAEYYHYFSRKSFTYRGVSHRNHNKLLRKFAGTDGIKTGYIRAAGFNLAASAVRNGRRLVAVVMGGRTGWRRDRQMMKLLNRAFAGQFKSQGRTMVSSVAPRTIPREQVASLPDAPRTILKPEARARLRPEARPGSRVVAEEPLIAGIPSPDFESPDENVPPTFHSARISPQWDIQVGAFRQPREAEQAAASAKGAAPILLDEARVEISPVESGIGNVYRARLRGISSSRAIQACKILKQQKMPCFAMKSPEPRTCETGQGDADPC